MDSYPKCKHGTGDGDINNIIECKDCIIDQQAEQIRELKIDLEESTNLTAELTKDYREENQRLKEFIRAKEKSPRSGVISPGMRVIWTRSNKEKRRRRASFKKHSKSQVAPFMCLLPG
jgi:septal ring factor EnvC (AmiA/AmiB activator)